MKKTLLLSAAILLLAASCNQAAKNNQNKDNQSKTGQEQNQDQQASSTKGELQPLPQGNKTGWETYTDSQNGFSIQYPKTDFKLYTDYNVVKPLSFVPACDETMVGCLFYSKDHQKGTNLEGAGVSVNIPKDFNTEASCYLSRNGEEKIGEQEINGIKYQVYKGGQGATGHFEEYRKYRAFNSNKCYEAVLRIGSADIGVYPPGTVKEFNKNEVWNKMEQVLSTFKQVQGQATVDTVKVFIIGLEDNGVSGPKVGCGDSAVYVERSITPTAAPLKAALEELLALKDAKGEESGLYNALAGLGWKLQSVTIDNGEAVIKLTGKFIGKGVCEDPRLKAQIEQTALQFTTVKKVSIFLDGKPLDQYLSGKGE